MKDIKGYENLYAVTSDGRVWSYKTKRFLRAFKDKYGYEFVRISKNGKFKHKYVHRLVAEAYLIKRNGKVEVNHKDENKSNNCVDNLEWLTRKENINYGTRNERTSKKVICVETGETFSSLRKAQEKYGICKSAISRCCTGERKTAGNYHWKFA